MKLNRECNDTNYAKYIMPENEKNKICKFMQDVNLNTGSIDYIVKGNKFIFLEVNPVGQFLFESEMTNHNLDKKIAEWLINKDNCK